MSLSEQDSSAVTHPHGRDAYRGRAGAHRRRRLSRHRGAHDPRQAAMGARAADHLRRLLMHEPRGHHDMYGVIPVAPDMPDADLAVLFMHNEGYPRCAAMR